MKYLQKVILLAVSSLVISFYFGQQQTAFAEFDCNTVSEIPISECEALVSLYNNTNGESWRDNGDWLISNTPCGWFGAGQWHGVSCSGGHVTRLNLNDNQLKRNIPTELGNLSNLQDLNLSYNQLEDSIPVELGQLSNLQYLRLSFNQLEGSIPVELGQLSNLQRLELGSNQLDGSIPVELGDLSIVRRK